LAREADVVHKRLDDALAAALDGEAQAVWDMPVRLPNNQTVVLVGIGLDGDHASVAGRITWFAPPWTGRRLLDSGPIRRSWRVEQNGQ
jgi:hypothetical protein